MKPRVPILSIELQGCHIGLIESGQTRSIPVEAPVPSSHETGDPLIEGEAGSPWQPFATAVVDAIRSNGATPGEMILAIPSAWCLCGRIENADGASARRLTPKRRETLLYELEEWQPVAAEQVAADFLPLASGWLGVTVMLDRVQPLIAALEGEGLMVTAVCPLAMLVLQGCRTDADVVMVGEDRHVDLFWFEDNDLAGWFWLPHKADDIADWLDMLPIRHNHEPLRVVGCSLSPQVTDGLAGSDRLDFARWKPSPEAGVFEAAVTLSADILNGRVRPMIDLYRGDSLGNGRHHWLNRPLQSVAAAAILFLLVSIGVMYYAAGRYDGQTRAFEQQQQEVFRQAFPDSRPPRRISRRLESELVNLRRGEGNGAEQPVAASSGSALHTLALAFDRLPDMSVQGANPSTVFSLERVILDGERLRLEGKARSHSDAGHLASLLGRDGRLGIQPPRTQALPDGEVGFVITGRDTSDASGDSP